MGYNKTIWKDRAVQFPNRYAKSGETSGEVTLVSSPGTVTEAGTALNAGNLNKLETQYDNAMKDTERRDYKVYRTQKDTFGIFKVVEFKRADNTLAIRTTLSGGTAPKYTTRTIQFFAADGTTIEQTITKAISYDTDEDWTQEV